MDSEARMEAEFLETCTTVLSFVAIGIFLVLLLGPLLVMRCRHVLKKQTQRNAKKGKSVQEQPKEKQNANQPSNTGTDEAPKQATA